jgi:hypothetical protein
MRVVVVASEVVVVGTEVVVVTSSDVPTVEVALGVAPPPRGLLHPTTARVRAKTTRQEIVARPFTSLEYRPASPVILVTIGRCPRSLTSKRTSKHSGLVSWDRGCWVSAC